MNKTHPLTQPLSVIFLALILLASGCAAPAAPAATNAPVMEAPAAQPEITVAPAAIVIAGPATPSSMPLLLAAENLENTSVQIIQNNSQANTLFLRGEISILVSGLSVGVDLYRNEAPVQVINTYVNDLSYLVTSGEKVDSLSALKGGEIYLPFEGSPIEEATRYLAEQEGLVWGTDLKPVYSPFDASAALLKEGQAKAVVLPEPFVSVLENQPGLYISLDYYTRWNEAAGSDAGYPQVAAFVTREWAEQHPAELDAFNKALAEAITFIQEHPEDAVAKVKDSYQLPEAVLLRSIERTHFSLLTGEAMKNDINGYYEIIGKPLDDNYENFFFTAK